MAGLTPPRLSALSVVVFAGPISLGDLAAAEQVKPPTMTRLVDALASAGLVRREAAPEDARRSIVAATEKGIRLLQQGRSRRIARLQARLQELTAEELQTLDQATLTLERVIKEV